MRIRDDQRFAMATLGIGGRARSAGESEAMKVRLSLVASAAVAAGAAATWLAAHQPPGRPTEPGPVLALLVGAALVGCGIASWRARPQNRIGLVMVLTGFGWFAAQLIEARPPWLNTIGLAVQSVWLVGLLWLLLSFPFGRLRGRVDRGLMVAAIGAAIGLQLVAMLYGNRAGLRCPGCSNNLLQVVHDNHVALGWLAMQRLAAIVVIVCVAALLLVRWLRASPAQRHAIAPVLAAGCATLLALCWTVLFDLLGDPLGPLPANVYFAVSATVPLAVLFCFLQRRLARGMIAGLVVELDQASPSLQLREALARALGDPTLELAFWLPVGQHYVDTSGLPVTLPGMHEVSAATVVERAGQPIAALIHDPVLEHNAELVQSVCAAAGLALENERLQAELRARLLELQASRARLVEATDVERRRIERDLHDGTQQRLVQIAMTLGLLETKLPADDAVARPLVHETRQALALATAELRELTHGINPPLLAEQGLDAALEDLCRRQPLLTRVQADIARRLPERVESAAYFTVSEGLTNAAKHSHATELGVAACERDGMLALSVTDNGIGGAALGGGSGLRGLTDRLEALGGRLTVSSPPGRGTVLRAEIPSAQSEQGEF
jgi:signal transduction histidine kinase